jgi:predicted PurR-regulated permease PerM
MGKEIMSKAFLLVLMAAVIYACFRIFKPFLDEILVAAILVSIFYTPYEHLTRILGGRKRIASILMCLLVTLLVILPLANFIVYAAQRSAVGYQSTVAFIKESQLGTKAIGGYLAKYNFLGLSGATVESIVAEVAGSLKDWLASGAANFIKGTTNFVISMVLILLTMFFFFIDGPKMVERIMYWTPLPNKYDREIFKKFRDVSFSTIVSSFATAIAQGIIGAIGFTIVGLPAFFAGVTISLFSLMPYIGASIIWVPVGIYLIVIGKLWSGVFILLWGALVISTVDNLIRAYVIRGKAQVHPIFVIFSILGGVSLFGFWGVIFGPLIISIAVTIFHIYEMEYQQLLEK